MKKIFLLFMVMINAVSIAQDFNIVGKWKGIDTDGKDIFLTFDSNGILNVSNDIETLGGEPVDTGNGILTGLKYEVNLKKNPFSLDFIMYNFNIEFEMDRKKGYFKIINDNIIELKQEVFSKEGTRYKDLYKYTFKREL